MSWILTDHGTLVGLPLIRAAMIICRSSLIDKHDEILGKELRTASVQQELNGIVVPQPLIFLRRRLIPDAIAVAQPPANFSLVDASLAARQPECPSCFTVLGQRKTPLSLFHTETPRCIWRFRHKRGQGGGSASQAISQRGKNSIWRYA